MAVIWRSLLYGLATSRSRATISASSAAKSISGSSVSSFIPRTSADSSRSTTKSAPCCLNASTGAGAPEPSRPLSTCLRSRPVMSGFCSEPDSANSFSMIFWVSTNHVCSWPVAMMCASVPSVSKPGNSGAGSRRPIASNHSDEGPGMMRIPWLVQIGSQLRMPST